MTAHTTAEHAAVRIFGKIMHSEASRDEWINQQAAEMESHIRSILPTNTGEAEEIGALAFGSISDEQAGLIVRLRSMKGAERYAEPLIDMAVDAAIRKTAMQRATLAAEELTPDSFLPD